MNRPVAGAMSAAAKALSGCRLAIWFAAQNAAGRAPCWPPPRFWPEAACRHAGRTGWSLSASMSAAGRRHEGRGKAHSAVGYCRQPGQFGRRYRHAMLSDRWNLKSRSCRLWTSERPLSVCGSAACWSGKARKPASAGRRAPRPPAHFWEAFDVRRPPMFPCWTSCPRAASRVTWFIAGKKAAGHVPPAFWTSKQDRGRKSGVHRLPRPLRENKAMRRSAGRDDLLY